MKLKEDIVSLQNQRTNELQLTKINTTLITRQRFYFLLLFLYYYHTITILSKLRSNILYLSNTIIPETHSLRRFILHYITKDIPKRTIQTLFNFNLRTLNRVLQIPTICMKQFKFIRKTTAPDRFKSRLVLAEAIIDELIPVISGRDYRIQKMDRKEIYRRYREQVAIRGTRAAGTHLPLSNFYIRQHILQVWKIHRSKDTVFCPHCLLLEKYGKGQSPPKELLEKDKAAELNKWQNKLNKARTHPERVKTQFNAYYKTKNELAKGLLPNTVLLFQVWFTLVVCVDCAVDGCWLFSVAGCFVAGCSVVLLLVVQ